MILAEGALDWLDMILRNDTPPPEMIWHIYTYLPVGSSVPQQGDFARYFRQSSCWMPYLTVRWTDEQPVSMPLMLRRGAL